MVYQSKLSEVTPSQRPTLSKEQLIADFIACAAEPNRAATHLTTLSAANRILMPLACSQGDKSAIARLLDRLGTEYRSIHLESATRDVLDLRDRHVASAAYILSLSGASDTTNTPAENSAKNDDDLEGGLNILL